MARDNSLLFCHTARSSNRLTCIVPLDSVLSAPEGNRVLSRSEQSGRSTSALPHFRTSALPLSPTPALPHLLVALPAAPPPPRPPTTRRDPRMTVPEALTADELQD